MKVIGLTGGIGTGKSTVSTYLNKKRIPIVDADAIAHEITMPGAPVLKEIRGLLGDGVIRGDGSLDRKAVAKQIFQDQALLKAYENLTTRRVVELCEERIQAYRNSGEGDLVVLDAPLLFESGAYRLTDQIWLVCADLDVRLERIARRDQATREEILHRIEHQMSDEEKKKLADYVIDNSRDLPWLYGQVDRLLERNGYEG